ncbi:MAG: hypothetical protein EHM45_19510 [Desulfobacteraceae bacterium]|nr:MAG: hypothetical protein EHM45_19510 [Desulfobacteraceae bacterium]
MTAKKISRKELLKPTDEFFSITTRTILFVREHAQVFSYIGWGFLAAILISMGVYSLKMYADKKGQEAYNQAFAAFQQYDQAAPDQKEAALRKTEDLFQKVLNEHKYAKVNKLALPELAYLKFQEKKYDEAITFYREYQNQFKRGTPYYTLAGLAIAACYEEKGEFAEASRTMEPCLSDAKEIFKEQIIISMARNYRLSNQNDKAKEMLKQFIEKFPKSSYQAIVKTQLSQLP